MQKLAFVPDFCKLAKKDAEAEQMLNPKIRLGVIPLAICLCASPLWGQTAETDPTAPIFKRVKPPEPGAQRRITVQLTELPSIPEPLAERASAEDLRPAAPVPSDLGFDWYWQAVSPSLEQSGPMRVARALDVLAFPPEDAPLRVPRLQALQNIANVFNTEILTATVGTRVSPALALAVISVESSGRTQAVSSAGASGLMQLMPATAERFGVTDRNDPRQNIKGGVAYLDWLLSEFGGDTVMALAGYNAGENAVKSHNGVPPFSETRAYVPKVLAAWQVARGLCMTPPELISDPCVFVGPRTASN